MDARVTDFVAEVAHDVVGLEVALFFQANPAVFDSSASLALHLRLSLQQVQPALDRLAAAGVLHVFLRGNRLYRCYTLAREAHVWHLLCLISKAYLDQPEVRKEIVRLLIHQYAQGHGAHPQPAVPEPHPLPLLRTGTCAQQEGGEQSSQGDEGHRLVERHRATPPRSLVGA